MVLPTAPPASISVSQIETEYSISSSTTKSINQLFQYAGGAPNAQCSLGGFSGKSTGTYLNSAIIDSTGNDALGRTTLDSTGNLYVCGSYGPGAANVTNFSTNPSIIGPAVILPATAGLTAGCVIKYNSSGVYQSAAIIDGTGNDTATLILRDSLDNIYAVGQYGSTGANVTSFSATPNITVRAGLLPATALGSAGYVVKWNSSGVYQSAAIVDGTASELPYSGIFDSTGNLYVCGLYGSALANITSFSASPSITVRAGVLPATAGGNAGFTIKWNSSGVYQGAAVVDGPSGDGTYAMAVDSLDNIYITGGYGAAGANVTNFSATPSIIGPAVTLPATLGISSGYVIKYNSSGTYQNAALVDGTSDDYFSGIICDSFNNIYASGRYGSTAANVTSFSATPNITVRAGLLPVTAGGSAGCVVKWNSSGVYKGTAIGDGTSGDIFLNGFTNGFNNIYTSCSYGPAAANVTSFTVNPDITVRAGVLPATAGGNAGCIIRWSA